LFGLVANVYLGATAGVETVMACHFTHALHKLLESAMYRWYFR
jgi:hypothetical protein